MALLLIVLLTVTPVVPDTPTYCADIEAVLRDAVVEGLLNHKEADKIIARCARAPEL